MALFRQSDLKKQIVKNNLSKSLAESNLTRLSKSDRDDFDIFMSHSFLDATEIAALASKIEEMGFSVYVDWVVDRHLDRSKVNKDTAEIIRQRMRKCKSLFFATSENTQNSKWMPWELGFFDGLKGKVAILPIVDDAYADSDSYVGREYLGLYPYVTSDLIKDSSKETLWVHHSPSEYVNLTGWLKGNPPYKRQN
ncbi:MAG: hypothetical protein AB7F43_12250 [Bacteriovoracia bacterium]